MEATGLSLLADAANSTQNEIRAMVTTRHSGWSMTSIVSSMTEPMISVIRTSITRLTTMLVARSGFITKKAT